MVNFADVQYCIYADIVGGSEKIQEYADVVHIDMVPYFIPKKYWFCNVFFDEK